MAVQIGDYVKASFNFQGEAATDLSLDEGDVVRVTDLVDENWAIGVKVELQSVTGSFPLSFVERLTLPFVCAGQKVFLAIENFPVQQNGDLKLSKGDIILGLEPVDDLWWKGKNGPLKGIFPLTMVAELEFKAVTRTRSSSTPNLKLNSNEMKSFLDNFSEGGVNIRIIKVPEVTLARAVVDVTAQVDGELTFQQGDLIEITEILHSGWLKGRCGYKEGLVSAKYIELLNNGYRGCKLVSYLENKFKLSTVGQSPQPSCESDKGAEYLREENVESRSKNAYGGSYNSENVYSHNKQIAPYGRVIYPFTSRSPLELSLSKNSIVELIRHLDPDWIEGEVDGKKGIFPSSCIEIFVDCPSVYSQDLKESCSSAKQSSEVGTFQNNVSSLDIESADAFTSLGDYENDIKCGTASKILPKLVCDKASEPIANCAGIECGVSEVSERHQIGLVLNSFVSEVSGTVFVSQGEAVEVIRLLDDNWLEFCTKDGHLGHIPRNYVEVINCWPKEGYESVEYGSSLSSFTETFKNKCMNSGQYSENDITHKGLSSDSESVGNLIIQCPSLQSKNRNPLITPVLPTLKNNIPMIKPSLSPKIKPPVFPKPATASKPKIAPKPSTVLSRKSFTLAEPISSSRSIANNLQVLPALENKNSFVLATTTERNMSEAKDLSSSQDVNTQVHSGCSSPAVSDNSTEKYCEDPHSDMQNYSVPDSITGDNNLGLVSSTHASFRCPTRAAPARPNNPAVTSLIFEIASRFNSSPSPVLQKHPLPPSNVPLNISNTDSPARLIPKRPAPKLQYSHSLKNKGTMAQLITPCIVQPQPPKRQPPRPTSFPSAPRRPPPRPADLKFFIPRGSRTEDNILELVNDLKKKLEENQTEIKKYEQTRSVLQANLLHAGSQDEEAETKNSLENVERQLDGLLEEEHRLKENLFAASPHDAQLEKARLLAAQHAVEEEKKQEEMRKEEERQKAVKMKERRRDQREKVIQEIINTERDYLFSLQLCLDTFYDEQKPPAGVDLEFLLGNMEEIADVSQKVLVSLEACVTGKNFEEQCLGRCFISFAEDMKNTYAPYCRNHDEVITAMEQYAQSTEISDYFNCKIESMKKHTNVFDMASILIRPVQRILKYPLLLNELLKNTEEGHPDREDIETAIKEMTDVAKAINEYKRRKDLVYKYKKITDRTFSDRISKLNMHSIKKKSTRMRGRLSTNFGIALQMRDEVFEKEEAKFRNLEKAVEVFLSSVQQYLEESQETMTCQTVYVDDIRDFYKGKECAEAVKLFEVTCKQLSLFDNMKATVDNVVVVPLNILESLFSAPIKVIEKRYDKMLDYNYQMGKTENDKELQAAKNDYEALNAHLLDELPKFNNLAFKMLRHCISVFVLARRDFMDQSLKETCTLLELPSIARKENLMDTFKIRHTSAFDHISMLSFIPKGFNTRVDTVKADRAKLKGPSLGSSQQQNSFQSSSGSQNENKRRYLLQSYPPDKLYTVTSTYNVADLMDISVTEGSVVGVVKQLDPMGNKERWFVDDGGSKGFVPCNILVPLEYSSSGSHNYSHEEDDIISILSGDSGDNFSLTGNDERVESHTNSSFTDSYSQQPQLPQYQYYYALYDFKSRYPNEASLTAGHPVIVVEHHDLDGNPEWWLVDSGGKLGYAPANYMAHLPDS